MKKRLIPILLLILIIIGKMIIDNKTINYKPIVKDSFSSYFIKGQAQELNPVIEILDKIKYDDNLRKEIQNYNLEIINSWLSYIDNKYICIKSNLNSCINQVEELKNLETRLKTLYSSKCQDGFTLILPSTYTNITNDLNTKIKALNKIIESPSAKELKNNEEIRKEKCNKAINCDSCRDGWCKCIYLDDNKRSETYTCPDKNFTKEN